MTTVAILAYHSISRDPQPWISPFTVAPDTFAEHLDAIVAAQATTMTVSAYVQALLRDPLALPQRTVLVTFDDGFADFRETALPAMINREIASTLYATTGFLQRGRGPYGDRMLEFAALGELASAGVELGGHSHTHAELDTLTGPQARDEIQRSKQLLEDHLGAPVRSFAYPHGYSSPKVRAIVRQAGYRSACAVRNHLSVAGADPYRLPRLLVGATHSGDAVAAWIRGEGARVDTTRNHRVLTGLWRAYRRTAVGLGVRRSVNL